MTDMVERVARAIGDAYETAGQRGHLRTMRPSEVVLKIVARAAIAAMREPTPGMVTAAGYRNVRTQRDVQEWLEGHDWQAMIDAALKGDKP